MRSADSSLLMEIPSSHHNPVSATDEATITNIVSPLAYLHEPLPSYSGPVRPRVPGYDVLSIIGSGGMGIVYKARHRTLNRTVVESGLHTVYWAGTDGTGAFRPDIKNLAMKIDQATFPVNGVVVFGRQPVVTAVRVTPPDFGPANGTQAVTFTLATYQSQTSAVTVSFLNQSSLSTLRTISLPAQAPGNVSVTWDGRANDGSLVAPGGYTVTVTAVDSLGNTGSGQILTRVEY